MSLSTAHDNCPRCNSTALGLIRSQFKKYCTDCGLWFDWPTETPLLVAQLDDHSGSQPLELVEHSQKFRTTKASVATTLDNDWLRICTTHV